VPYKIIFVTMIVLAFFVGAITSSTLVSAQTNDTGNPFEPLQKQIDSFRAAMTGQSCSSGKVVGGIDSNGHIICVTVTKGNAKIAQSPILFQNTGAQFILPVPLKGHGLVIPLAGIVDNLVINANVGAGPGKHLIVTILKNGATTPLSCTLENSLSCTDTTHSFSVNPGDLLEPLTTPSRLTNTVELRIGAILNH